MPPFHDTFFIMPAIDDTYSPISAHIDMIQAQNKMLTIWLLLSGFVCLLQPIEDDDVGKISAAF